MSNNLEKESQDRNKIMKEVTNKMEEHSYKIIELKSKVKEAEINEVKYSNLERELKELTNIYELKLNENELYIDKKEKEILNLRKKVTQEQTTKNNLKSLLELVVKEYGEEMLSELSGLSIRKIKEYLN